MTKSEIQCASFLAQEATTDEKVLGVLNLFQTTLETLWDTMIDLNAVTAKEPNSPVIKPLIFIRDKIARDFGEPEYFNRCHHPITEDIGNNKERCTTCKEEFQG
jgi:hypothetical protein